MAVVHYSQAQGQGGHQLQDQQTLIYNQSFSNNFTNTTNMTQLQPAGFSFLTDSSAVQSLEQQQQQQQLPSLVHQQPLLHQQQLQHQQREAAPCSSPVESCGSENLSGSQRHSLTLATGRRNLKAEKVAPEEERRRALRREKNRRAAAKCRQKRQECIASLEEEVQELEQDRTETEQQLQRLQQEAHRLLTLLELHSENCHHVSAATEPVAPLKASQAPLTATSAEQYAQMVAVAVSSPTRPNGGSPARVQQPPQRPIDLPLPVAAPDALLTPSSTFQQQQLRLGGGNNNSRLNLVGSLDALPSVTASWETGGLGLTPLLSSLDTSRSGAELEAGGGAVTATSFAPGGGLIEIKTESVDYAAL